MSGYFTLCRGRLKKATTRQILVPSTYRASRPAYRYDTCDRRLALCKLLVVSSHFRRPYSRPRLITGPPLYPPLSPFEPSNLSLYYFQIIFPPQRVSSCCGVTGCVADFQKLVMQKQRMSAMRPHPPMPFTDDAEPLERKLGGAPSGR